MTGGVTNEGQEDLREIEALDAASSAYVRALREEHALPELVRARVARRLRADASGRRGRELWALIGLAAAAAVVLIVSSDLLPRGRRGTAGRSVSADAASYSREAEAGAQAVLRGGDGRRQGVAGGADSELGADASSAGSRGGMSGGDEGAQEAGARSGDGGAGASGGEGEESAAARGAVEARGSADAAGTRSGVGGARAGVRASAGASAGSGDGRAGSQASQEARASAGARSSGGAVDEGGSKGAARGGEGEGGGGLDLAGERRVLEEAWRALKGGDLEGAITAAKQHRERHPAGALTQEREAIEVIARCRAEATGASAAAEAFAARFGQSPWMSQIRAACSGSR